MRNIIILVLGLMLCLMSGNAASMTWYSSQRPITYTVEGKVEPVVSIALDLFKGDMQQVTGKTPYAVKKGATIRIIEIDKANAATVAALKKQGVPVDKLKANMDAFYINANANVNANKQDGILIVGNNGRGCAYGILELSRKAGVSPWVWWGDVTPAKKSELTLEKGFSTYQAPSVEYRGIFLNDEDFSLREWCTRHFEPPSTDSGTKKGTIGKKTYKKICELLLRLRGNAMWPGMHTGTTAFFTIPGAQQMADSCGIVIGTSHCEPLLRNNVDEWNVAERGPYNYITNKNSVLNYWTQRLQQVKGSNNYFYTIGMRGVHDGTMEGVHTMPEKVKGLNDVIVDQRKLLGQYINKDVTKVPQVFIPYKEVLDIMEAGVNVPDDVTLMWCDDNYGYMTRLSDEAQQKRPGGGAVYYHLSYWGRPHDYLWLTTEQPGLIYNEMKEAYDHNARKLWIVNVHDPKVAAYDLELFMDMAWDISSVTPNTLEKHLQNWLTTQFGAEAGGRLLPVMKEWYRLTVIRKPEFMGWSQVELDKKKYNRGLSPVKDTEFSLTEFGDELDKYLDDYAAIAAKVERIGETIKPELKDAYFAAVVYPVKAAYANAVQRLEAQKARRTGDAEAGKKALAAHQEIKDLTDYYWDKMSGGKWKYNMNFHARELPSSEVPVVTDTLPRIDLNVVKADPREYVAENACDYQKADGTVYTVEMLGHSMKALNILKGSSVTYNFNVNSDGDAILYTAMIPTQSNDKGDIRYSVSIDGGTPKVISLKEKFRSEKWKLNVLRGQALNKTPIALKKGAHTLTIKALDNHIVADQWMIDFAKDRKFYVIPVKR